ncbi:MAG TPA: MFS transporter [Thermoplasmata archaeon]
MAPVDDISSDTRVTKTRLLAGISANVLVLGIVSLLTDLSSEMIYSVLPLFLVSLGATGLVIGLIEGAAEATASFLKVFSGWYSDRVNRRKPFIQLGYGLSSFVKPLLVLATAPWHVFGIRISERVGKGIRSAPRDALIADSTDESVRGLAYGFHKAMDSAGAVLGPIAAIAVLALVASMEQLDQYRVIFLLATIPAFAAVFVIFAFVREKEGAGKRPRGTFAKESRNLGRPFFTLLAIVAIISIGEVSSLWFILRGKDSGLSDVHVIGLYTLYNIIFVVTAIPSGSISDRAGRKPVIAASFAVVVATYALMALDGPLILLASGFVLLGVYKGASEGVLKAYVVDVVPDHLRGTALGTFHTAVGMAALPGSIIAGLLWDYVGHWATFAYGAAAAVFGLVLLLTFGPAGRNGVTPA